MAILRALSVLAAFLGVGLCLFLAIALASQRRFHRAAMAIWIMMLSGILWHLAALVLSFHKLSGGGDFPQMQFWRLSGQLSLTVFAISACVLWMEAARARERAFSLAFGVPVLLLAIAVLFGDPFRHGYATLTLPFVTAWFLYWRHPFGLTLSSRAVFALSLGVSAALFLFLVRRAAVFVEDQFPAGGILVELALLFAAGLLWLPFHASLTGTLNRRSRIYTDFASNVIDQATHILEVEKRMRFFAGELASRFRLRRVILADNVERRQAASQGEVLSDADLRALEDFVSAGAAGPINSIRPESEPVRHILLLHQVNVVLPLRLDNSLVGLLLLDTRPLLTLEDNEAVLLALAPQIAQSLASCRLVEEKIRLERDLARQEHLAGLGKAAATIAHEIKNPLSAIKAIAQLLAEDEHLKQNYSSDLAFLASESDRLDRSIRQLLGFSRPPSEAKEDVDFSTLVRSTSNAIGRQAQPAGIEVRAVVDDGLLLRGSNGEMVQQILLNLLLNAVQASAPGQQVTVEAARADNGTIRLAVSDQGPGIPEEIQADVFEPFFTTKAKGAGLGLAIVRKNATHLGGEVRLESPGQGGARITVTLPEGPQPAATATE
jgi:signal transduction histidine kinase